MIQSDQSFAKKILLLGGEGFIGRNIAEYFSEKNTCFSVGNERSLFERRMDVFLSGKPYEEVIQHKSEVIIHLIDNKIAIDSFVEQEKKLVENIGLNEKQHLIIFSSAVIYANPNSEYGERKQALEKFYTEYCNAHGVRLTIFRLFNTFGSYQIPYRQGSLVANLIYNAISGKQIEINDREATRDFLFAGDIPKFVRYVVTHELDGVYDIGSGGLMSIQGVIDLLEGVVLKRSLDISYRNIRETILPRHAEGDLVGKVDLIEFEEGLRKAVNFYEDNLPTVQNYVK